MSEAEVRIGLIGDLHGAFDPVDSEQLDACEYERLVFVGDLGPGTLEADRKVARAMARLRTPTMVMPGNNDAAHAPKLRAELGHQRGMASLLRKSGATHRSPLVEASADVTWCGYGTHAVRVGEGVTIVSARPYSMGGGDISFADALLEQYGIPCRPRRASGREALHAGRPGRATPPEVTEGPRAARAASVRATACRARAADPAAFGGTPCRARSKTIGSGTVRNVYEDRILDPHLFDSSAR